MSLPRPSNPRRNLILVALFALGLLLFSSQNCIAKLSAEPSICKYIPSRHYGIQQNLHASEILVRCGVAEGGSNRIKSSPLTANASAFLLAGEKNLITGPDTAPRVTQAESFVWAHGNVVMVAFNDSRGDTESPENYSGLSMSTDWGNTFTRLGPPSPFSGHGANWGDPVIVYNEKLSKWFAGDLVGGCGAQGIGLWYSSPTGWTVGACAHSSASDDRESMWVDNNPASPFYGRMYISFNDFSIGAGGALKVIHSDDGVAWSAPVTLSSAFKRDVQLTGSPGSDGTVFVAALDENGGKIGNTGQRNYMYRSVDGGASWTVAPMGSTFTILGGQHCRESEYTPVIFPIWGQTGYGQPAVGPNGVVHYVYAAHSTTISGDVADVFYVRSADNGLTWSAPVRLNTDSGFRAQFMPSLRVTPSGVVEATWYDQRNASTSDFRYQRYVRFSTNNGVTWGPNEPVTAQLLPEPHQNDPKIKACWAGDYNYTSANGEVGFDTWTDSRVLVGGQPTEKVFYREAILSP